MLHETLEYLGIAFVSSVLLIIMSKIILQALIRRPADYYNAEELRDEELMLNAAGISITLEHETNPEGEPMEDTHLEAKLGDFVAAEPEEIITDIPAAVHESIEIIEHDEEEESAEDELQGAADEIYQEPDEFVEIAETEELEEPVPEAESVSEASAEEPAAETEPEPENEDTVSEPEELEEPVPEAEAVSEAEAEEPAAETEPKPEAEEPVAETEPETKTAEPEYSFKIKAKTSRTKKPKRKEDEEKAEEEAAARAAMEAAKAAAEEDDRLPEWTESYADIRESLEKAFTERESGGNKDSGNQDKRSNNKSGSKSRNRKRKPKPSMKMNKKELTEIAKSRGIDVPEEATKREILDLIYQEADRNR